MNPGLLIPGIWLGLWLGIIFHEGGHFICARVRGLGIHLVSAGKGPLLLRWQHGETAFELHLVPLGGFAAPAPAGDFHRGKMAFCVLGGVLGNIALLLLIGLCDAGLAPTSPLHRALIPIAAVQYLMLLNIVPFRGTENGKRFSSDGLYLLRLLFFPLIARRYLKNGLSSYQAQPASFPGAKAFASRLTYLLNNTKNWTLPADRLQAIEALERELHRGGLPRGEELLLLDVLITRGLVTDDPSPLHAKLDQWSQRASELGSGLATIRGSRGSVLAMLGRYQEAKTLLTTVPTSRDAPLIDVIMTKIFLAQALSGLGELIEARRLISEARAAAPAREGVPGILRLIARVEAEIGKRIDTILAQVASLQDRQGKG